MNSQSKATKKYDERNGVIAKTYKLKKSVVEAFAEMCEENEKTQSEVLTALMENYSARKCFCKISKNIYEK